MLFFFTIRISAQEALSADTLVHRLWKQTQLYPREKIYARTDRPVYVAGDTLRLACRWLTLSRTDPRERAVTRTLNCTRRIPWCTGPR